MTITKNHLASTLCLLGISALLHGQEMKFPGNLDEPVHKGDSVVIQVGDYYGDVQWQKSINRTDWLELPDENQRVLSLIADFSAYFRAAVSAGNCEDVYSDTVLIDVIELGTVNDVDGNTYKTVKIGTQWWMAENLKTTKYRNGSAIETTFPDTLDISGINSPKYQWVYPDIDSIGDTYGRLYTWYTVTDSNAVCPSGWHVPSDEEWTVLTDYLNGASVAGGILKEMGTAQWQSPNKGATNERDFAAQPGGYRYYNGTFGLLEYYGEWWSSSENQNNYAWNRDMGNHYSQVYRYSMSKKAGLSVRCVKD